MRMVITLVVEFFHFGFREVKTDHVFLPSRISSVLLPSLPDFSHFVTAASILKDSKKLSALIDRASEARKDAMNAINEKKLSEESKQPLRDECTSLCKDAYDSIAE